jgi:hypothetical protein
MRVLSVGCVLIASSLLGCSSSSSTGNVPLLDAGPDVLGSGGRSGTSGASNAGGSPASGGKSNSGGASNAGGTSGNGGTSNSGGASNAGGTSTDGGGADGGLPDASIDAASDGAIDGAEAGTTLPSIDAGADCLPPSIATALSPSANGLPTAGLAVWLRADRGVYKTASNGVCAWVDQSGNGNVFRDATAGQPQWVDASVGGQAAIQFSVASGPMTVGGVVGIAPTSGRTFIAVVKLVDTAARFQAVMQGQGSTAGTYLNLDANTFNTVGSREGVYATNNAYDSPLATSTAPRVHVYALSTLVPGTSVLGALDYRVNGATQTLTRTSGGLGNGNLEDFSQANFTLVGNDGTAFLAEALIYDHALGTAEKKQVEQSLEARYGITP